MTSRRKFTKKFKTDATRLVLEQGYSTLEAAKAKGVSETSIRRWTRKRKAEISGIIPQGKAITSGQDIIMKLKAQIEQLELDNDILMKASALYLHSNTKR